MKIFLTIFQLHIKRVLLFRIISFLLLGSIFILWPTLSHASELLPKRIFMLNGMKLILVETHALPIITAKLVINAGSRFDPEKRSGLAHLTASLLQKGTLTRDGQEISQNIEFVGGRLSVNTQRDFSWATLRVLKKDIETGFDLLSDITLNPSFKTKEIKKEKKRILGFLLSEKDNPRSIAQKAFNQVLFTNHPFQYSVKGTEKTLPNIQRSDILWFYKNYYQPQNTSLTIVGDITESEARAIAQKYFGNWKKNLTTYPNRVHPLPLKKLTIKAIHKDISQSNIVLGHLGISRNNSDFPSVVVMNYILGRGGFSSRLMTEIRDNHGLAYHISSRFSSFLDTGSFFVVLQTKNRSAKKAIVKVLEEMKRIQKEPVSDQELIETLAYLTGSLPLRLDTTSKLANFYSNIDFYGLGLDYADQYVQQIEKVTKEDVQRVAKKYLHPDRFILVVVGKTSEADIFPSEIEDN